MKVKEILRNSGITLVALIITIIVLLILAGVSISFVFNGGILDKTQSAVNEYENAADEEKNVLDKIDKYLEDKLPKIPEVDENGLAVENTTIVAKDDKNIQIVIPQGFAPAILNTDRTDSMPGENGAVKNIMPNEQWNNITKEDINKGIVVVDHAITYDDGQSSGAVPDFNEYVWIPIVDSSKFKRVAWTTPYGFKESGGWGSGGITQLLAEVLTLNRWWEDNTTQEYKDMINSVNTNKGYYISRYEASKKNETTAQSKRNQNPWNNISQLDAITASSNMKLDLNSHLIYGIEWDSILQWSLDSGAIISSLTSGKTKVIEVNDVQSDSISWGNYSNSIGDAANKSGTIQVTGASEYWKINNIYDFSGNMFEWTQEKYSTDTNSTNRGGAFGNYGFSVPAAYRNFSGVGNKSNDTRI